jgi:ribose transport system substrate-binding protein
MKRAIKMGAMVGSTAALALTGLMPLVASNAGAASKKTVPASVVAQAQQLAAPFQSRPGLEVNTPITKTIPTGKKLDFITCSSPGCTVIADRFVDAAHILGWSAKVIVAQPAAASIQAAYQTAIRDKPQGLAVAAVSAEEARSELATLQSMHIPVVTVQDPDVKFGPIIATLYNHRSSLKLGKITADEMTALGCGNGKTLYVNISGYLVLTFRLNAYEAEMKRLDPAMTYQVLQLSGTASNFITPVVSAVRAAGNISCVYEASDGVATGLPQALKAAGISPLPKIITDFASNVTLQNIHSGLMTATDIGDAGSYGYIYIDTFARYFTHSSLTPDTNAFQNIWFVNSTNAPATTGYSDVANLKARYTHLWGK